MNTGRTERAWGEIREDEEGRQALGPLTGKRRLQNLLVAWTRGLGCRGPEAQLWWRQFGTDVSWACSLPAAAVLTCVG